MLRKEKRAQEVFGMSFGMIFSIFIILFIILVAFLAIKHFMNLNRCTQVGFFYDDLQQEVERIWTSGRHDAVYEATLPAGFFGGDITYACFGKLTAGNVVSDSRTMYNEITKYYGAFGPEEAHNIFVYPPQEACDGTLFAYELKCRNGKSDCLTVGENADTFFCEEIDKDGKLKIRLSFRSDLSPFVKLTDATGS